MEGNGKICVVIPAYNEEKMIEGVISGIKTAGYENIIIVDDGSRDETCAAAKGAGAVVLRHKINRGKGAAAKTGIEAAKLLDSDIIVTMDGDGQHNPQDISRLAGIIQKGHDVALGTRSKTLKEMPWYAIIRNYIANAVTWYIYGLWVTDSQSGFRAYSRRAADLIDTRGDRYEYDSEVIREIRRHRLKHTEVPITVRYTEYSIGKTHKQGFWNGLKTLYKMIWNIIS